VRRGALFLALCACSGVQSVDRCDRGGKVFAAIARAVDVAGFACAALGGDSDKCLAASEAVEVARGAFGGVCALVAE
jgi:hypothetical protein